MRVKCVRGLQKGKRNMKKDENILERRVGGGESMKSKIMRVVKKKRVQKRNEGVRKERGKCEKEEKNVSERRVIERGC